MCSKILKEALAVELPEALGQSGLQIGENLT